MLSLLTRRRSPIFFPLARQLSSPAIAFPILPHPSLSLNPRHPSPLRWPPLPSTRRRRGRCHNGIYTFLSGYRTTYLVSFTLHAHRTAPHTHTFRPLPPSSRLKRLRLNYIVISFLSHRSPVRALIVVGSSACSVPLTSTAPSSNFLLFPRRCLCKRAAACHHSQHCTVFHFD